MDAAEFTREIRRAKSAEERIAWFGALLGRETRKAVEVVGESAVEVYLSSAVYVSQDVDLVGDRTAIEPVLRRWGFRQVEGRSRRLYWVDRSMGLVDLIGPADRSGLPPRKLSTPFGPVTVGPPEPLIIRRLWRAERENSEALFGQAVALARLGGLDWEYLESEARYEKVEPRLRRLRRALRL